MVSWQAFSPPPSSRAPRVSLAPKTPFHKTPFPIPFKRLPRRLFNRRRRRELRRGS